MTSTTSQAGELSFSWRSAKGNASLYYYDEQDGADDQSITFPASSEWSRVSIRVTVQEGSGYGANRTMHLGPSSSNTDDTDTIYIDRMTWTPDGSPVEPGADDVREISQMSFSGGVLSLVFTNADERFSYDLHGTNELVTPLSLWPVLWTTNGTGTITIEPPVAPGETKMFYYLETRKKE